MNFLLISIACSVAVSVLLKLARKNGIGLTQAVAVNYPVAALLSLVFLKPDWHNWQTALLPQSWLLALLGVLLPSVFVVMGRAAEQAGIVKADAAQRLSLASGQEVTVATATGSITLPAVVGGVSDGTVWLPECSAGSTVHQTLGAGHGSQVTLTHAAEVLR